MELQLVTQQDVRLEEPLPWPLFDKLGQLLFVRGQTVGQNGWPTDNQVYRDISEPPLPAPTEPAPRPSAAEETPPKWDDQFPPRGVKPQIGERVRLRRMQQDTTSRYDVSLIGFIKGRSILVTDPVHEGRRVELSEGELLDVQMLIGRNIYQFETQVIRVSIAPTHYLHLRYPDGVRTQELRLSPWVKVNLGAIATSSSGHKHPAFLTNLSGAGAQFTAPIGLANETEVVSLTFPVIVDDMRSEIELDALVQHIHPVPGGDGLEGQMQIYGVSFQNARADHLIWLKCLVYQRISEGFMI